MALPKPAALSASAQEVQKSLRTIQEAAEGYESKINQLKKDIPRLTLEKTRLENSIATNEKRLMEVSRELLKTEDDIKAQREEWESEHSQAETALAKHEEEFNERMQLELNKLDAQEAKQLGNLEILHGEKESLRLQSEELLAERDELTLREQELSAKITQQQEFADKLTSLNNQIGERQQELRKQSAKLSKQEEEYAPRLAAIEAREEKMAEHEELFAVRLSRLKNQENVSAKRIETLDAMHHQLKEKEEELKKQEIRLEDREKTLRANLGL